MKLSKGFKTLLVVSFLIIVIGCGSFGVMKLLGNKNTSTPTANIPVSTLSTQPGQSVQPTQNGQSGQTQPVQPTNPSTQPGQIVPAQTTADGYYPGQCKPGDTRPALTVAFDDYAGFYPVIVQYMTKSSTQYCINLMPKWSGSNWDKNAYGENDIEEMMKANQIQVYFGSNGALALWDANSGRVIWTTDQSAGADAIVVRNSVTTRTDPKTGKPAPNFNDALGQSICTSRGSADNYFILTALQSVGFQPGDVTIRYTDNPVGDFTNGLCTFVVYWDPIVRDAQALPDTSTLITTKDWRTVSDYVVVSREADNNMQDALVYFLADFNVATEAFTNANLPATAQLLISWTHDGDNMAGWLFLDPNNAAADLARLMEGVAPATLNSNVTMFESDLFGWNLVKDQFDKTHITMQAGGIFDNKDNTKGSLYNSGDFISDKYVKILNKNGAVNVAGDFSHKYITDINESLPNVDNNTLFTLPEILSLKHKNIAFVEGQARQLQSGEYENLVALLQPLANQMAVSPDMVIVIQGGHGLYSTDPAVMATQAKLAFRRASYIKEILSDPKGLNIPINRIVINAVPIAPDHTLTPSELPNYIVVLIKLVNTSGLK